MSHPFFLSLALSPINQQFPTFSPSSFSSFTAAHHKPITSPLLLCTQPLLLLLLVLSLFLSQLPANTQPRPLCQRRLPLNRPALSSSPSTASAIITSTRPLNLNPRPQTLTSAAPPPHAASPRTTTSSPPNSPQTTAQPLPTVSLFSPAANSDPRRRSSSLPAPSPPRHHLHLSPTAPPTSSPTPKQPRNHPLFLPAHSPTSSPTPPTTTSHLRPQPQLLPAPRPATVPSLAAPSNPATNPRPPHPRTTTNLSAR